MNFLKSKFGTVALAGASILILFVTVRLLAEKYHVDKQIRQLTARAEDISSQNQQLSDLVNYLNTDEYRDKAAREQLGLKKDGEVVVALPQQSTEQSQDQPPQAPASHPQEWFDYFFKH
ncbi:MAG TPA: septum formation initiator family protein [Patescibacteria group bacterium]|nr:septum formation initiator family protein [Patescibacteria group bacterium]